MNVVIEKNALNVAVADRRLTTGVTTDQHNRLGSSGTERKVSRVAQSFHGVGLRAAFSIESDEGQRQLKPKNNIVTCNQVLEEISLTVDCGISQMLVY